jgi:hypothetical protein
LYEDSEKKAVDKSKPGTNGLTIVFGTIPVGAGLVTAGQLLKLAVLNSGSGNSQPADVFVGKQVLRVSVWKGLWIPRDPA